MKQLHVFTYDNHIGGDNIETISDERTDEHYLPSNPYENYGKKVLTECDFCEIELIEGDEVCILNECIYCSSRCAIDDTDFEKKILTIEWYGRQYGD